jgi:nucleoid-associated protein YgaU
VKATVAERVDGTSAILRHGGDSVVSRTAAARAVAPGRRLAGQKTCAARSQRSAALRLVAADGCLVPRPSTAEQADVSQRAAAVPRQRPPRARRRQQSLVAAHPAGDRVVGAARTPVRLTRRGRVVVMAAATLAIGVAAIVAGGAAHATGHSGAPAGPGSRVTRVEIRPGESLWSVAEAYDPDADTRVVISEILQLNSLTSDQVQPGQVLWVPRG